MSTVTVFSRIQILTCFNSLTLFLHVSGGQFVAEKYDCVPTNNSYQISLLHDLSRPVISLLYCTYFCNKESNCVALNWITANAFCQLYQFDSQSTTNQNLTSRNFCRMPSLAPMVLTPINTTPVTNLTTTTVATATTNLDTASANGTTSLVTETIAATNTSTIINMDIITNSTTDTTTNIVGTSGSATVAACTPQKPLIISSKCNSISCVCDQTLEGIYTAVPSLSDSKCWFLCAEWAELGNNCSSFAYDPFDAISCKLTSSSYSKSSKPNNVICDCKDL